LRSNFSLATGVDPGISSGGNRADVVLLVVNETEWGTSSDIIIIFLLKAFNSQGGGRYEAQQHDPPVRFPEVKWFRNIEDNIFYLALMAEVYPFRSL